MFGGKPVTVQMAGGGSKTLTLMPQQQGITQVGKIVRIPSTSGSGTDQPKLMVVQRAKQGTTATIAKAAQLNNHTTLTALTATTTASTSFDGPATTDAALAALAAEAGLIDPEPQKDSTATLKVDKPEPMETESNGEVEKKDGGAVANAQETPAVGLLGGTVQEKLGLKGGSKVRLGLFGGSPVGPPTEKISYRGGLLGGGAGEKPESSSSGSQSQTSDGAVNGTKKEDDEASIKMEIDEDGSESALDTSGYATTTTTNSGDDDIKEEGDALAALASAALDHSKEMIKQEAPPTPRPSAEIKPSNIVNDEKDNWFTVGFIKGNSYDVQNFCFCQDNIADYTSDDLPDLSNVQRAALEPGTAYKFRVAAINSVGRGEWSEVSHLQNCQNFIA